jgi:outer membrane receptor for ferrienterochelin and colicins
LGTHDVDIEIFELNSCEYNETNLSDKRMPQNLRLSILAVLIMNIGLPRAATAQAAPGDAAEPGVTTVTIRGNRGTLQERFEAPGSRVIVGRDDIEQMGADTVSDVLRQLPGVFANTGADGRTEIRMRGMDRGATQILVDGERTSNGRRGGQLPFDQIPSELIERIEVIRSPTPEFSGASGGTINIVLKQSTIQRETNMRLTNQFFQGRQAGQLFFSRTGPLKDLTEEELSLPPEKRPIPTTYFFMVSAYERLGGVDRIGTTTTMPNPNGLPNDGTKDSNQTTDISRSRTKEILIIPRLTIKPNLKDTITINPLFTATQTRSSVNGFVDLTKSGTDFTTNSLDETTTNRTLARVSTTWAHRFTANRLETRFSIERGQEDTQRNFNSNTAEKIPSNLSATSPVVLRSNLADERAETVWNLATKLQGFEDAKVWALGAEVDHRVLTANTLTSTSKITAGIPSSIPDSVLGYRAEQLRSALWGQNEWTVFSKSTLVGGLRYEGVKRDTVSAGVPYADNWTRWQPSLNLRTPINPGLQFRVGVAQNTRIPALLDAVDRVVQSVGVNSPTRPDTQGNPKLKAETTLSFDMGFEVRLGNDSGAIQGRSAGESPGARGQGAGGRANTGAGSSAPAQGQAGINLFVRDITDPITRKTEFKIPSGSSSLEPRWIQTPENGIGGVAWGLETDLKYPLNIVGLPGWNFNGNASLLKSKIDLPDGTKGRITGQPHYLLNLSIAKPLPRSGGFFGGGNINFAGASDLKDSLGSTGRSRAVGRLDAYIGQVLPNLGYWRLGVYNLNNVGRDRVRSDLDSYGNTRIENTTDRSGRSIFLTVGTRF